jgi:hypothetical protein
VQSRIDAAETEIAQLPPPSRRLPLVAAVLAITVTVGAGLLYFYASQPPALPEGPRGEPLKLKLEFAFPAARR